MLKEDTERFGRDLGGVYKIVFHCIHKWITWFPVYAEMITNHIISFLIILLCNVESTLKVHMFEYLISSQCCFFKGLWNLWESGTQVMETAHKTQNASLARDSINKLYPSISDLVLSLCFLVQLPCEVICHIPPHHWSHPIILFPFDRLKFSRNYEPKSLFSSYVVSIRCFITIKNNSRNSILAVCQIY